MSAIEAAPSRAISANRIRIKPEHDLDGSSTSELYRKSAEFSEGDSPDETFGAALARIKSQTSPWRPYQVPGDGG